MLDAIPNFLALDFLVPQLLVPNSLVPVKIEEGMSSTKGLGFDVDEGFFF